MRLTLTAFFLISAVSHGTPADTTPPAGRLVYPQPLTIINGNTIKLKAEAHDSGSGIKEVAFFVKYRTFIDREGDKYGRVKKLLGKANRKPYEYIWDCSDVPDQDVWSMKFWCDIEDNAGNITSGIRSANQYIVLDRNPSMSDKMFPVDRKKGKIAVDGYLEDWHPAIKENGIRFGNGDNSITAYSCWDRGYLYLGIEVKDKNIYSGGKGRNPGWEPWKDDGVEIFFDTRHNHNSILQLDDKKLIVSASGIHRFFFRDFKKGILPDTSGYHAADCNVTISGTLNNMNDQDDGFVVETALAWKDIGLKPYQGLEIGFDVFNTDIEIKDGAATYMSWCGNQINNINNPSEWGNMVLEGGGSGSVILIILFLIIAIIIVLLLLYKKRTGNNLSEINLTRQEHLVKKAQEYLCKNYMDSSLNREKLAEFLNISSGYLGKIFKKTTKKALPDYLNDLRVKRAEELLTQTEKKVTEIGFEVGFGTLDHFIKTFKAIHNVTPSEFRKKSQ